MSSSQGVHLCSDAEAQAVRLSGNLGPYYWVLDTMNLNRTLTEQGTLSHEQCSKAARALIDIDLRAFSWD